MQSTKVIMTKFVRWKKLVKLAFTLDLKDGEGVEDVQDTENNTDDKYIRVEVPFFNLITEFLNA